MKDKNARRIRKHVDRYKKKDTKSLVQVFRGKFVKFLEKLDRTQSLKKLQS